MTDADREYISECNREYQRDIHETIHREHAQGLNPNPDFGLTAGQIRNREAAMNGPHESPSEHESENEA